MTISSALRAWLLDRGAFVDPGVELVECMPEGRENGTYAKRSFVAGEVLLRVPRNVCLEGISVLDLAFKLANIGSDWKPYIDSASAGIIEDFMGSWTNAELAVLKGTSIFDFVDVEKETVQSLVKETKTSIYEAQRIVRWIWSRSVEVSPSEWLISPGIDALNHAHPNQANAQLFLTEDGKALEVISTKAIEFNEEIRHVYDDVLTPAAALQRYGVLSNLHITSMWAPSSVLINVAPLLTLLSLPVASTLRLLPRPIDQREASPQLIALTLHDPLPETLLALGMLKHLEESDMNQLKTLGPNRIDFFRTLAAASNAVLTAVILELRQLLQARLDQYYKGNLSGLQNKARLEAALIIRDQERAPLIAALNLLSDNHTKFRRYLLTQEQ